MHPGIKNHAFCTLFWHTCHQHWHICRSVHSVWRNHSVKLLSRWCTEFYHSRLDLKFGLEVKPSPNSGLPFGESDHGPWVMVLCSRNTKQNHTQQLLHEIKFIASHERELITQFSDPILSNQIYAFSFNATLSGSHFKNNADLEQTAWFHARQMSQYRWWVCRKIVQGIGIMYLFWQ